MKVDILDSRLAAWAGYSGRHVLREIPGARWNAKNSCWTYPLAWFSALALGTAAKKLRETINPTPEAASWVTQEQIAWRGLQDLGRTVAVDPIEGFYGHQVVASDWLAMDGALGGRLDTSEVGAGKTRSALRAAQLCWSRGERGILLVSTLMAIKYGWRTELEQVKNLLPLPDGAQWQLFTVGSDSAVKRAKVFEAAKEANTAAGGVGVVLLIHHEQLRAHSRMSGYGDIALKRCPQHGGVKDGEEVVSPGKCHAHPKELNELEYVAVCIDEVHRMKNPKAQTTRAAWAVCDSAPRVWGLTGTPTSTSVVEDTWALNRLVYGREFPARSKWCEYFAEVGYDSMGFWQVGRLRDDHEPEFRQLQSGLTRRVLKTQVLDLPPLQRGGTLQRIIPLGKVQRNFYTQMRDHLVLQVKEGTITAPNLIAQMTRLLSLSSASGIPGEHYGEVIGTKTVTDEYGISKVVDLLDAEMLLTLPSNKVDAVVEMIRDGDVEPGTVFQFVSSKLLYLVRDELLRLKIIKNPGEFGIVAGDVSEARRALAIEGFQQGKIPWFAFTAAAGGAGITLTRANTMVAVQRPYSPILYTQAEARVHRAGSEIHKSVNIIDLISEDTIELDQLDLLAQNADLREMILQDHKRLEGIR